MTKRNLYTQSRFDFEIGYLIKSPCRGCGLRHHFPGCMDDCVTLDRIQTRLAQGVSSCRNYSSLESFRVQLDDGRRQE